MDVCCNSESDNNFSGSELTDLKNNFKESIKILITQDAQQEQQSQQQKIAIQEIHETKQAALLREEETMHRVLNLSSLFATSSLASQLKKDIFINVDDHTTFTPIVLTVQRNSKNGQNLSFLNQLKILSGRTLLNIVRNPYLLLSHYLLSFFLASNSLLALKLRIFDNF